MQYAVPQFIEVEDQILPHLTIKQFLMLVFGGILGLVYWVIFDIGAVFFILLVLTFLIIIPISFLRFNGRPILANFPNLMRFMTAPRYRVFARQGNGIVMHKQGALVLPPSPDDATDGEQVASRLKKLAYFLDAKTAEEDRLLRTRVQN